MVNLKSSMRDFILNCYEKDKDDGPEIILSNLKYLKKILSYEDVCDILYYYVSKDFFEGFDIIYNEYGFIADDDDAPHHSDCFNKLFIKCCASKNYKFIEIILNDKRTPAGVIRYKKGMSVAFEYENPEIIYMFMKYVDFDSFICFLRNKHEPNYKINEYIKDCEDDHKMEREKYLLEKETKDMGNNNKKERRM